jgi:hypothetical protein
MKCPICGGKAKDITSADFNGVSVRCLVDGDFDVAPGYVLKLQELSADKRQYALNAAIRAARPGKRPMLPLINADQSTARHK